MTWTKKPATPATILQREVISTLNQIGFFVWRNNPNAVFRPEKGFYTTNPTLLKGVSDILGLRRSDGRFVAIELKASKGDKLTREQIAFLENINNAGGLAFACKSLDDCLVQLYLDDRYVLDRLDIFTVKRIVKLAEGKLPPKRRKRKVITQIDIDGAALQIFDQSNVYPKDIIDKHFPNKPKKTE